MALEDNKKDWSLVGYLATVCSCQDPSDLRRINSLMSVYHTLETISPERYSVEAWHTAARYILGVYINGSPAEIKRQSLDMLIALSQKASALSDPPEEIP